MPRVSASRFPILTSSTDRVHFPVPARSWLAHVSDVREIGGLFDAPKTRGPSSEKEDDRAEERWDAARKRPVPPGVANPEFFRSRMHDSGVIALDRKKGVLRVRLDSIVARDFARILEDALDRPPAEGPWPVDLVLHDPTYVRAARADARGALRFEDPHRLGGGYLWDTFPPVESPNPRILTRPDAAGKTSAEFLYDWFYEGNGRLQWIAQLYTFDRRRGALSNEVYLMVDCARATAEDRCPETFERAYGPAGRRLYERARANAFVPDEPFDLWNEAGLARTLALHGLARDDFLPAWRSLPSRPNDDPEERSLAAGEF